MHTVTLEEERSQLGELLDEAARGEDVVILRDNAASVKLVPMSRPGFGSMTGQIVMADDFDAPLDEFAEYMP